MNLEITLRFDGSNLDADETSDLLDNVVKLIAGEPGSDQLSTEDLIQIHERFSGTELIKIGDEEIR